MTTVQNCNFTGVKEVRWDLEATEAVLTVAKALLNMTELFRTHGVVIESLLKIEPEQTK